MDHSAPTPQQNPLFTCQYAKLEAGKIPMDDYRGKFCHLLSLQCSWLKIPLNEYNRQYTDLDAAIQSTVIYEDNQHLTCAALQAGGAA